MVSWVIYKISNCINSINSIFTFKESSMRFSYFFSTFIIFKNKFFSLEDELWKEAVEMVEKIQNVMREHKIKSLSEIASELIPFFKKDDDSLTESIISRLE